MVTLRTCRAMGDDRTCRAMGDDRACRAMDDARAGRAMDDARACRAMTNARAERRREQRAAGKGWTAQGARPTQRPVPSEAEIARERALGRQARLVAVVIAATTVVWLGLQVAGARLGWQGRYAFLVDFAALGAFAWGLVSTWWIWRARRAGSGRR